MFSHWVVIFLPLTMCSVLFDKILINKNPKNQEIINKLKTIAEKRFNGHVIFFSATENIELVPETLQLLMNQQKWDFRVYDENLELPLQETQPKRGKERNVLAILDEGSMDRFFTVFSRLRIIGAFTQILVVVPELQAEEFLETAWMGMDILNMTVLTYGGKIKLLTFYPYDNHRVAEVGDDFFPNKIPRDFKQYPLKIIAEPMDPYVFVEKLEKDGIEIRILELILKHYNMKPDYVELHGEDLSRVNYRNGRPNGLFRVIYDHEADMLVAGLRSNAERFEISETLVTHTEDQLLWAFPRPQPKHDWRSIYEAFAGETWAIITVLIFIVPGVMTFLARFQKSKEYPQYRKVVKNFLYSWGYILELGAPVEPISNQLRILMAFMFFYNLNISCSYKSSLVTLLTTPKPGKIYTNPMDAFNDNLNIHVQRKPIPSDPDWDFWQKILIPNRYTQSYNTTKGLEAVANRISVALSVENPSAYIISKYFLDGSGKPLIQFMKQKHLTFSVAFFMAPGHPLEKIFNRKLLQLIESGIMQEVRQRVMFEAFIESVFKKRNSAEVESRTKVLTITDLFAIFLILVILLSVSFIIFVGELVVQYRKGSRRKLRLVTIENR